jgi:hypothetical protein
MPEQLSLEDVVDLLDRYQVRATYGAVAAVVGRTATFLMTGIPRSPRYSWIVNQKTLMPTGYTDDERHPALTAKSFVIKDEKELRAWMARTAGNADSA